MPSIQIPYHFDPRTYQARILRARDQGFKRIIAVMHRRAGKDKTLLNMCVKEMFKRVGVYWYLAPTYAHGKKIIWDGIGSDGFRFRDHFPRAYIEGQPNEQEMKIRLKNGSIFQIIGTDKIGDAIVGPNPVGCVFSEFSLMDPSAYRMIRPILRENKGWAAFAYTPRGRNHGYQLFQTALKYPDSWYVEYLTIKDTHRDAVGEDGAPVLTEEDIEEERREGVDEELIQQEYYCSWVGYLQGSYYGKILSKIESEGHVTEVPWIPELPVDTWWDIGQSDATAIWFTQSIQERVHFIDYLEESGEGIPFYARELLQNKQYRYGKHFFPWDMAIKEFGSGEIRAETARKLGLRPQHIMKRCSVADGHDAVRKMLPQCYFDRLKTERGINALQSYHKEWDEKRGEFRQQPVHDWASHGADAFRTFAVCNRFRSRRPIGERMEMKVETDYNIFD